LPLRATTYCFSDPQRDELAAILYAALGSAKLKNLDPAAQVADVIDCVAWANPEAPNRTLRWNQ
jgi:hypothetical protein